MNCRTFVPPFRPVKAPRHEAGSVPRHLIPCRYFARGYCSRGDSCMFSHSLHEPTQPQGLQSNHVIIPFWNNYSMFSPQTYAKRHPEIRRSSLPLLHPQRAAVPPPSSPSSVTTADEGSAYFNLQSPNAVSPTRSTIVSDIMKPTSTLITPTRVLTTSSGDTSCDEFSTTRSDVTRDEFLSPPTDVHFAEFYSIPSPACLTPIPYVQRGFGYRDKRSRGRENRRRRTRNKPNSNDKSYQERESSGSPADGILGGPLGKSGATSDSDCAYGAKSQQETWRVIGGGVMLGTPTSATSRRGLKRLQSSTHMVVEDHSNGSYDESLRSNLSTDESFEFSELVALVRFTVNRPPLADIIERPKSSLPTAKVSPLAAFFTHAEVA